LTSSWMCASRPSRATQTSRRPRRPVRQERFNSARVYELRRFDREGVPLPLTQTQLAAAVADRAEITKADAKRVLGMLEEIVLEELGNAQKVRVGGLVQLTVRVKPAQKKRKGRNPATGEASRSPPSPRASTFARDRSPRPRPRCHRCRKRADDSPTEILSRADQRRSTRAPRTRASRRVRTDSFAKANAVVEVLSAPFLPEPLSLYFREGTSSHATSYEVTAGWRANCFTTGRCRQ
jgi:DNA-binding protein HU-beta